MIKRVIRSLRFVESPTPLFDVVLHIGAPKCGSSAIQRFCVSNRDELLALGYYYPEHSLDINGVSGGHTQLAGALLNGKTQQASITFHRWLQEARAHKATLLLSAEALYGQHEAMSELCQELRVKVVAFLRHPIEYLLANHNQGIKRHFATQRLGGLLPEFLGRPTGHLVGLPLLSWADTFEANNCCFMPYKSPATGGLPVEAHFLRSLDLSENCVIELSGQVQSMTNRSYVKSALELKRLLNIVLKEMPEQVAHQVDWSLQGYSDRAYDEAGYTIEDLSIEMHARLEQHLLKQMAPVVTRFPELKAVAKLPREKKNLRGSSWLDLSSPFTALATDVPHVVEEVRSRAIALRDEGMQGYAFCKLLDILNVEFIEPTTPEPTPGLSVQQRNSLQKPEAREADYLREMALLLERQGLFEDALFVIEQAALKRPHGKGIQIIKARLEQKRTTSFETINRQVSEVTKS